MDRTDQDLIDETLAGTLGSYDVLMKRYEQLVYKVAYGFGKERESALDITQNSFVKAYHGLGTFRRNSNFKTWLARIAYHEGVNWTRKNRRHLRGRQPLEDEIGLAAAGADPEDDALRQERKAQILEGLQHLSERHRLALTLRYFQGMPVREVAEILQCSEGTAKNILFRGVRRLKQAVAPTA